MDKRQLFNEGLALAATLEASRDACPDHDYIFAEGYAAGAAKHGHARVTQTPVTEDWKDRNTDGVGNCFSDADSEL